MIAEHRQEAVALLEKDRMRHLAHLKYLHLYPADIECFYVRERDEGGVLLSHPTSMRNRDRAAYPGTDYVLMPTAFGEAAANALLAHTLAEFTSSNHFTFKFCDELTRRTFEREFVLTPVKTLISFTTEELKVSVAGDAKVIVSDQLHEDVVPLFEQNHYSREELVRYFGDGAMLFTVYEGVSPVSICLIYQNFDTVWEIGGVYTVETARRKGYARQVVAEALKTLIGYGLTPRYQAEHTNTNSLALAESLGLKVCLRFEHYTASRRAS
jgi:GNAT superfamily N-acetyltransferase